MAIASVTIFFYAIRPGGGIYTALLYESNGKGSLLLELNLNIIGSSLHSLAGC